MSWLRNKGLRFKLTLGISFTMLISLGLAFFIVSQYIQTQLWQRETRGAESLNSVVAALIDDAMMAGRKEVIHDALDNLGQSVGGQIDSIAIYDDQFVLTSFATSFPGGRTISQESLAVDETDPNCWVCHRLPAQDRPTMTVVNLEGQEVLRNVVPLYNEPRCQTCHGTGAPVLGKSIVDVQLSSYRTTLATVTIGLGIAIATTIIFVTIVLYQLLRRIVIAPVDKLVDVTHNVVQGNLTQRVHIRSNDEIGQLGISFNSMTEQISNLLEGLEQRVEDRTRSLEQRTSYLEASASISQAATTVLDPNQLISQVVELIKETFNLYYVGIFLVDERNEWCVLQAGTGIAGQAMLEQNHRIKIGEGMIGWCVENNQSRIALDVGADAVRFDNPFLPHTRSEGALPLRSRGRVLGALTVQSSEPSAFDQDILTVLQTMADQIATALENAELFARSETALEAERRAYGEMNRQAWLALLEQTDFGAISTETFDIRTTAEDWSPEMQETARSGKITRHGEKTIHIPIILRDQTLGVVRLRKKEGTGAWSDEEIQLMDTLVDQLENSLETARLYSSTQIQAERTRLTHEVTDKLHRSNDMDTLMQTLLAEISNALGASSAFVQLSTDQTKPESVNSNPVPFR
jgi:GAF domain-containing protein/HAMP domain-containing protein